MQLTVNPAGLLLILYVAVKKKCRTLLQGLLIGNLYEKTAHVCHFLNNM